MPPDPRDSLPSHLNGDGTKRHALQVVVSKAPSSSHTSSFLVLFEQHAKLRVGERLKIFFDKLSRKAFLCVIMHRGAERLQFRANLVALLEDGICGPIHI